MEEETNAKRNDVAISSRFECLSMSVTWNLKKTKTGRGGRGPLGLNTHPPTHTTTLVLSTTTRSNDKKRNGNRVTLLCVWISLRVWWSTPPTNPSLSPSACMPPHPLRFTYQLFLNIFTVRALLSWLCFCCCCSCCCVSGDGLVVLGLQKGQGPVPPAFARVFVRARLQVLELFGFGVGCG